MRIPARRGRIAGSGAGLLPGGDLRAAIRATSGRRSGGTVAGGWRRAGSAPSSVCTSAVTLVIACSYASSAPAGGFCSPETFRMNCRAAASISSSVAGGCSPRSSVMFRHIRSW